MLILLFTLVLIVLGVCKINLSSLNLTENERRYSMLAMVMNRQTMRTLA